MSRLSKADIIEALLFASDKPVPLAKIAQIVELDAEQVQAEIDILRDEKSRIGALQIVEVAEGWQLLTKPEFAAHIRRLRDVPKQRLSRAAFEVLAIVAYRQPVTRGEVEQLRSVDCAGPLQFLLERKLIAFAGRKDAPGRPWLYETTPLFLENFGLRSLDDLPSLSEWSALNAEAQSSSLFNRGAMKAAENGVDEIGNAEESTLGAEESTLDVDDDTNHKEEPVIEIVTTVEENDIPAVVHSIEDERAALS
jgi:segregation and condensation protein B